MYTRLLVVGLSLAVFGGALLLQQFPGANAQSPTTQCPPADDDRSLLVNGSEPMVSVSVLSFAPKTSPPPHRDG